MPRVREAGARAELAGPALAALLPAMADLSEFWRYEGGLTTPACNQIVQVDNNQAELASRIMLQWTLFKTPLNISSDQLREFRSLLTHEGEPLGRLRCYE